METAVRIDERLQCLNMEGEFIYTSIRPILMTLVKSQLINKQIILG